MESKRPFLAILVFAYATVAATSNPCSAVIKDINEIRALLSQWNETFTSARNAAVSAEWDWAVNLTDYNLAVKNQKQADLAELTQFAGKQAKCIDCASANCAAQESRRVMLYQDSGMSILPVDIYNEYNWDQGAMDRIYRRAQVCRPTKSGGKQCLSEADITNIMASSQDYCERQWAWQGWHNATGRQLRGYFPFSVHLQNEAALLNGFSSAKVMWTQPYWRDDPQFYNTIERAWQQIKPLYQQLHAFVRTKLQAFYGKDTFPRSGHIPAHLLGSMMAEDWSSIEELVIPYPSAPFINITKLLLDKMITPMQFFRWSDSFFQGNGFFPMDSTFWMKSVFLQRPGVDMSCHPSAWDLFQPDDFRVKQCARVTEGDYITAHKLMAQVQYFMEYQYETAELRNGANPGFLEAIGDFVSLSVMTPEHLKAIDLLPQDYVVSDESRMNTMMSMALKIVAFVPYSYLVDGYRWSLFEKTTTFDVMNANWWNNFRCAMQGVSPPVTRTEDDFDAGAEHHVAASYPYIDHFVSQILQFQFHIAICKQIGFTKDWHKCDINQHPEATGALRAAMSLGQSIPYPQVLKMITGSDQLDASALLSYFQPLADYLNDANRGQRIGWDNVCNDASSVVCN